MTGRAWVSGTKLTLLALCALSCQRAEAPRDTAPPEPCRNTIDVTVPEAGATDAYYQGDVEFWLDDPDEGPLRMEMQGPDGEVLGGTRVSPDRQWVRFDPKAPLEPQTSYESTLDYCTGSATIQFTTSVLGLPLEEPLVGRVYLGDLSQGRTLEPTGWGELLGELVPNSLLLGVVGEGPDGLEALLTWTQPGSTAQEPCYGTIDLVLDDRASPAFVFGPQNIELITPSGPLELIDFELSGAFSPDATFIGGAALATKLDAREIHRYVSTAEDEEEFCTFWRSLGDTCGPCPSDGEPYCVEIHIDQMIWESSPDYAIEPTTGSDDPDCDSPVSCSAHASGRPFPRLALLLLLAGLFLRQRRRR